MTARIHATFPDGSGSREAGLKLQALRAMEVSDGGDGTLSATVEDDLVDRVMHLIRQTGGMSEME